MGTATSRQITSNDLEKWSSENQENDDWANFETTKLIVSKIREEPNNLKTQLRESCRDGQSHAILEISLYSSPAVYDEETVTQSVRDSLNLSSELTIKFELLHKKSIWTIIGLIYIYRMIIEVSIPVTPQ